MRRFTIALLVSLSCACSTAWATEQGTLIHFPAKLTEDWKPSEEAAAHAAQVLGKGAWLRFDNLWHEQNWEPFVPVGHARMERIVALCKRLGFKPLMNVIPHPWPGSPWFASYKPKREWGDPEPGSFPWIARRYAETVQAYRAALKANGIEEKDAAIQFGNEPASGHPGGNGSLPQGTWSAQPLWAQINAASDYGALNVVSPAISMQDHKAEVAGRERETAVVNASTWTAPVTSFALHNRVHRADLAGDAYAAENVRVLRERAATVAALWPRGEGEKAASRARGVWVTEGYIAVGDAGGDRAEAARALAKRLKAGVPGVAVFIWYRWFPQTPEGQTHWAFDDASKAAIGAALAGK